MTSIDLRRQKSISAKDIEVAGIGGAAEIIIDSRAVLEDSTRDMLAKYAIAVRFTGAAEEQTPSVPLATAADSPRVEASFYSRAALDIKDEICSVGRKLWLRGFVDGNGGNISYRIGENEIICTPTLFSKFDMTSDDLCLIDLDGNQLAGRKQPTSEVRLHLEVYKNTPQAKAVVHCHSPYATAYAICGCVPPPSISSEFDVFIGRVALASYETPGTLEFAETVRPYVAHHNAILLANHGVLCWADTPTHAEWYVENLEAFCQTFLIARQFGVPYSRIPKEKAEALKSIRKKQGLPDCNGDASFPPVLS
ncbi:MAG: class II aldolase/adducin family protein [Acidobacteriota bacterium]|jgi:L-fuculose-phosphate aldolase|nr:class II aldolase/adducin family protein [Acidobacteriota bacterium]